MGEFSSLIGRRDWEGLQSRWVLPAARRLYLVGALLALLVAILALVLALLFHFGTWGNATLQPVPDIVSAHPQPVATDSLDSLFSGPQHLHAEAQPLSLPVQAGDAVATLAADSLNGIEEFQLIGGAGSDTITEAVGSSGGKLVNGMTLRVTAAFADRLNAQKPAAGGVGPMLSLRVIAKDSNGNLSAPQDLTVRVRYRGTPVAGTPAQGEAREDISGPAALREVADALASIAAQKGTAEWIDAYQYAMAEPQRCGVPGDETFMQQFNAGYRHIHAKLTASNLNTFYKGMCAAWTTAIANGETDASAANTRRAGILAENLASEAKTELRKTGARVARDAALGVALSAIFFFMIVALFLAFMAIEGHSHAVRRALQVIADRQGDRTDA